MRVQVQTEGGFAYMPSFAIPTVLDTEMLPTQDAEHLRQLVQDAHFFALPEDEQRPRRGADYRQYTITVEDGPHCHTVRVTDPVTNPHLERLITLAQQHGPGSL